MRVRTGAREAEGGGGSATLVLTHVPCGPFASGSVSERKDSSAAQRPAFNSQPCHVLAV